jgi:molecular chaperone GrpE
MTGKHKHEKKQHAAEEEIGKKEFPAGEAEQEQPADTGPKEAGPAEQMSLLKDEFEALNDKYLRLYSEFDNYRKRTLRERIELGKTASVEVISTLLPVIDDMERAIKAHADADGSVAALTDGITLIYNKLMTILGQQGLEQMKSMGEEFDTDFHEAVTNIPAPDPDLKGRVVDEIQKGYLLSGKVIRFAKVVVGS